MTTPVQSDQLRVSIEMGDDYQPSDRLTAAIGELTAALHETETDDVSGFFSLNYEKISVVSYDSSSKLGSRGNIFPKTDRGVFPKTERDVFRF